MNAYRALGMAMEEPYFLALLAEAQASEGLIEEGLATLAEALVALPSGRDFFYKAELYRLRASSCGSRLAPTSAWSRTVSSRRLTSLAINRRSR